MVLRISKAIPQRAIDPVIEIKKSSRTSPPVENETPLVDFFAPYRLLSPEEEVYVEACQVLERENFVEELQKQRKRFPLLWGSVTARSILAVLAAMRAFLKSMVLKRQLAITSLEAQKAITEALTKAIKQVAYHEKWQYNYNAIQSFISGGSSVANAAYTAYATSSLTKESAQLNELKGKWETYQSAIEQKEAGGIGIGFDPAGDPAQRAALEQQITDIRLGRQNIDEMLPSPIDPNDRLRDFHRLPEAQQNAILLMTKDELVEARSRISDTLGNLDKQINTKSNEIASAGQAARLVTDAIRDLSTGVINLLQGTNAAQKGDAQAAQSEIQLAQQLLQQLLQELVSTAQQMAEQVRQQQDLLKQIEQMNSYRG